MEKNYKYNIPYQAPEREAIRQHMDFDALMQRFEESPAPPPARTRLQPLRVLITVASMAAAVAFVLYVAGVFSGNAPVSAEDYFAARPCVDPVMPQLEPALKVAKLPQAQKGGVVTLESGSRLVVPAFAFANDKGKQVEGEVTFFYREMHDYVDFFLAGIPLSYDSLGNIQHLNSAGMIEVYAEQQGRRLQMAPDKSIQVELVNEIPVEDFFDLPEYYVYQLDTNARTWRYNSIDVLQFSETEDAWGSNASPASTWQAQLNELETEYLQAKKTLEQTLPSIPRPIEPQSAAGNQPTIELDFSDGQLALTADSELRQEDLALLHKGTIWEISPNSPAVDTRAFKVVWEQVRMRRLGSDFELTLIHPQNSVTLLVRPVLSGQSLVQARERYKAQMAEYEANAAAQRIQLGPQLDSLEQVFAARKQALQAALQEEWSSEGKRLLRRVVNRFVIHAFGVWNCARPTSQPQETPNITLLDDNGLALEGRTVFVANPLQNTLYKYYATANTSLGVLQGTDNTIWLVDAQGQLLATGQANTLESGTTITLQKAVPPADTPEELRKVLLPE